MEKMAINMSKRSGFRADGVANTRAANNNERNKSLRQKSRIKNHENMDQLFIFYYSNSGKPNGIPRKLTRLDANKRNHELALEHIKFMDQGKEKQLWQWILNYEDQRINRVMNTFDHRGMVLCKNPIWGNIK